MTEYKRVTKEDIDNILKAGEVTIIEAGVRSTIVHFVMPNGFELVAHASCVDPDEYDVELGTQLATERLRDQIALLEGYRLFTLGQPWPHEPGKYKRG